MARNASVFNGSAVRSRALNFSCSCCGIWDQLTKQDFPHVLLILPQILHYWRNVESRTNTGNTQWWIKVDLFWRWCRDYVVLWDKTCVQQCFIEQNATGCWFQRASHRFPTRDNYHSFYDFRSAGRSSETTDGVQNDGLIHPNNIAEKIKNSKCYEHTLCCAVT